MSKLLLIDGHSILFRAFYGMPPGMTAPDGLHTNALYGFLAILGKVTDEEKPDYLAVAFDLPSPTFRHDMYPDYKGNRTAAPDEFREQVPVIKKILTDMKIPVITCEGYEADDILGTLACQAQEKGVSTVLISGDRDLLQIADRDIEIVIPKTRGGQTTYERYRPEDVKTAFGVTPEEYIQLKALMGDSSDNIPGLPGVGPKTAARIMETYGSIENAYAHLGEMKPKKAMEAMRDHYDDLLMSLDLVTIRKDAPVSFDPDAFAAGDFYNPDVYEDFKRLGFKSLLSRFEEKPAAEESRKPYTVVRTKQALDRCIESVLEADAAGIAVVSDKTHLYAAGIATEEETRIIIPGKELPETSAAEGLAAVINSGKPVSTVNAKEILKRSSAADRGNLTDCIIAAYLLDPLKADWTYDAVAQACLNRSVPSENEIFGKKGPGSAAGDAGFEEKLCLCASGAAETALKAAPVLLERLRDEEMLSLFRETEMPLVFVLADMEREGILADREELAAYGESLRIRIEEIEEQIYEEAGERFNINSPKQLGAILFEKLKLKGGKKTKTGFSTAAEVLEKLAPEAPVAAHILEYRMLSKLKSTYADGLPAFIDEDSRIRTTFHQTITATGRLSSTDPNLQNIPMREELGRMIRKCFYPKPGYLFVDADYSQIELRILAHMSGDEKLIEAYREEKDIHRITASQVFHVPFDEVTETMRRNAKAVNFGIVYGISSFGLSQGLSISRAEAQEYIQKYFEAYPKIKSFLDGLVASAKEKGYAVSLFGRRRPIPELKAQNFALRGFGERAAMNSPIQGSAADIIKIAMIRVFRRLKRELPEAKLILQIHDELLVEAPEERAQDVQRILTEEMKQAASLSVSLETDCHTGRNWYEAK